MTKTRLLFLIILIEGYVVLACELLAIRQLIPFVGSGTEVIAIVISAVLMPLAVGYHRGGQAFAQHYRKRRTKTKAAPTVRRILLKNILSAMFLLAFGLSYPFLEFFFGLFSVLGMENRIFQTALFSALFLVYPVYALGQTVPLVSNYFSRTRLSEITGKMLFFSTTGSFFGSVFSTLVLMTTIGVHNTVIVTLGLLLLLALLLVPRLLSFDTLLAAAAFGLACLLNCGSTLATFGIVADNNYNTVAIKELPGEDEGRIFVVNRSHSSKVSKDPERRFAYIRYIEDIFINPLLAAAAPPREILVIGAGGFTLGEQDTVNHYTFVDIDPQLKKVAEEHFLPAPLSPNKRFIPMSARAFVHSDKGFYDLIVLDAFSNVVSLPMECTTREFLLDVKNRLKPGGAVVNNVVSSPTFADRFSVRYHNTFASVFPSFSRQTTDTYNPWNESGQNRNNLYIYFDRPYADDRTVYTDDKNTYSLDR